MDKISPAMKQITRMENYSKPSDTQSLNSKDEENMNSYTQYNLDDVVIKLY